MSIFEKTLTEQEKMLIYVLDCQENFNLDFIMTPNLQQFMLILGLLQNEIVHQIEMEIKKHD